MKQVSNIVLGKKEVVQKVIEELGNDISKTHINKVIDALLNTLESTLTKGQCIRITGYFSLEISTKPKREVRNPKTGKIITLEARKAVKMKVGSRLKNAVLESTPATKSKK